MAHIIGYPLNKYQSLMVEPIDVQQTLHLFEKTGKIKLTVTSESPIRLVMIELVNWDRYQSEYQRQKKYRGKRLRRSDSQSYTQSNKTEAEGESDGQVEKEEKQKRSSTTSAAEITQAFDALGHRPFGPNNSRRFGWRSSQVQVRTRTGRTLWSKRSSGARV